MMAHVDQRVLTIVGVDYANARMQCVVANRDGSDKTVVWQSFVPMRQSASTWIVPPAVEGVKAQRRRRK